MFDSCNGIREVRSVPALDLGTTTGWALRTDGGGGGQTMSGVESFKRLELTWEGAK